MFVVLYNEKTNRLEVTLGAEIIDDCLIVLGQDIEYARRAMRHDDRYEYSYTFDQHNTNRLFSVLRKGHGEASLMNLVIENFSGMNGCRKLREICEENDIIYSFSS
jgi:hypothetical protein